MIRIECGSASSIIFFNFATLTPYFDKINFFLIFLNFKNVIYEYKMIKIDEK